MNNNIFDSFEKQAKSMMKFMAAIWIALAVIGIGSTIGVIWFVFWCLNHFNVI